jgi:uncharacterized protein YqjF (DUF2071 family)
VAFGLPYRLASTRLDVSSDGGTDEITWTSVRRDDGARAALRVRPEVGPSRRAVPGLERFLVERYSLYSSWHGHLLEGSLTHRPWRIRNARLVDVDRGTVAAAGIEVVGVPHVLVGDAVDVRVHPFRRVRSSGSDGAAALRRPLLQLVGE